MHCFTSSRGNSPNSGPIARPEPLKLSCDAGNVDSIGLHADNKKFKAQNEK